MSATSENVDQELRWAREDAVRLRLENANLKAQVAVLLALLVDARQ